MGKDNTKQYECWLCGGRHFSNLTRYSIKLYETTDGEFQYGFNNLIKLNLAVNT